jgi:hypothetical protein
LQSPAPRGTVPRMRVSRGRRAHHGLAVRPERWALGALLLGCGVDQRDVDTGPGAGCLAASCAGTMDAGPGDPADPVDAVDGVVTVVGSVQGVAPLGDGVACLSESRDMELRPLALYLMLDSSGSMEQAAGTRATKWDAVQRAIRGFLVETADSDLLLGMQFFPLAKPGSSFTCTSQADCGADGGICPLRTCREGASITNCLTDADCPGGPEVNPCVNYGLCSNTDPLQLVACELGGPCGYGLGNCQDLNPDGTPFVRQCTNATACDAASYGTPAVEIQAVSAGLLAIDQALTGRSPQGDTPTAPALQGALDHARAWALAHPNQTVATLLATDGEPTECGTGAANGAETLNQVLQIASAGVAASSPIRTYVIGVFPKDAPASGTTNPDSGTINPVNDPIANVNAIATAGGTEKAALIDSGGAVEQQFLEALRNVKDAAAPCQFELTSTDGLNFYRADLLFDAGNGTTTPLPYVDGLLGCAAKPEGWYYDTPPAQGTPRAVSLCPNVCQLVKAAPAAGLLLQLGCAETN